MSKQQLNQKGNFGESSRGNTIRSNRTESLWEEICLSESLWEDHWKPLKNLWKPLKKLWKPLKTSEDISKPLKTSQNSKNLSKLSENPPSQRPSQRQISSQRLSVLLPLFCCPLNSLRPFGGQGYAVFWAYWIPILGLSGPKFLVPPQDFLPNPCVSVLPVLSSVTEL